jgi:hypothetical protein
MNAETEATLKELDTLFSQIRRAADKINVMFRDIQNDLPEDIQKQLGEVIVGNILSTDSDLEDIQKIGKVLDAVVWTDDGEYRISRDQQVERKIRKKYDIRK